MLERKIPGGKDAPGNVEERRGRRRKAKVEGNRQWRKKNSMREGRRITKLRILSKLIIE